MKTFFEYKGVLYADIPRFFVDRYEDEIDAWSDNLRKIGLVKNFILREGFFALLSPNPEQGAQLIQVKLKCRPARRKVEISPLTERDEELIWQHCERLERAGVKAKMVLQEPPRPWLPFVPTKVWDPPQL